MPFPARPGARVGEQDPMIRSNRLIREILGRRPQLLEYADVQHVEIGDILYEPGDDVVHTYFPLECCVVSFMLLMQDGRAADAATIGREGAVGGVVSSGHKPAFAQAVVLSGGPLLRLPTARLEEAKADHRRLDDLFARYADALLAQVLQSVGCNALHGLEARCARWLLAMQDRVGGAQLQLTQETLSQMLGVQRTSLVRVVAALRAAGMIDYRRGKLEILDRTRLEQISCECYEAVRRHYDKVLPEANLE